MTDTITGIARRQNSPHVALALVETWRAVRHPAILLGAAVGAVLLIGPWLDLVEPTQQYVNETYDLIWVGWSPLYLGAFIAANMIANRERDGTTSELFRGMPADLAQRTRGILMAVAGPAALAAILAAAQRSLIAAAGGFTAGSRPNIAKVVPTWPETLTPAIITIGAFVAGVAVARTTQSRSIAMVFGGLFAFTFFVSYWVWWRFPFIVVVPAPLPYGYDDLGATLEQVEVADSALTVFDASSTTWYGIEPGLSVPVAGHLVYLAGVALLMAAWALRRSGAAPVRLALSGVFLTVIGVVTQVVAHYA